MDRVKRFGIVLRDAREEMGMTQEDLADLMGTGWSASAIAKRERGDRRGLPTPEEVDRLEAALELDDERLTRAADYATKSERQSLSYGGAPLTPEQEQDVLEYIEFRRQRDR